jgi:DUF2934 family protein
VIQNTEFQESRPEGADAAITESDVVRDGLPSEEGVAVLAHSYWEARGYQGGSPEEDWLRAEQELSHRGSRQKH